MDITRSRVVVRHVSRRRPDGINYEILTAGPGDDLHLIARMSQGGDAVAYGQTIAARVHELDGEPVELILPH